MFLNNFLCVCLLFSTTAKALFSCGEAVPNFLQSSPLTGVGRIIRNYIEKLLKSDPETKCWGGVSQI